LNAELGNKLTEAGPNTGKIFLNCAIRMALWGLVLWAGYAKEGFSGLWVFMFFVSLIIAALPMRHLRDKVEFFRNGISYHQKNLTLEEIGVVQWINFKSSVGFFENLFMDTDAGRFDFTYVKDAKKQFNRAYGKQIVGGKIEWNLNK
jgi:hypothetical protein